MTAGERRELSPITARVFFMMASGYEWPMICLRCGLTKSDLQSMIRFGAQQLRQGSRVTWASGA